MTPDSSPNVHLISQQVLNLLHTADFVAQEYWDTDMPGLLRDTAHDPRGIIATPQLPLGQGSS